MPSPLRDALREQFSVRNVLTAVAILALFRLVLDLSWLSIAVYAATFGVILALEATESVPGVDERYVLALLSALLLAGGGFAHWRGEPVTAAVVGVLGAWLLLDTLYKFRHGIGGGSSSDDAFDEFDDLGAGETMLRMQLGSLVAQELEEEPKTVAEIAAATDMTESRVRQALELHRDAGVVYPVDGAGGDDAATADGTAGDEVRYALDESKVGPVAFVRDNGARLAKRLLRPFRLFVPA